MLQICYSENPDCSGKQACLKMKVIYALISWEIKHFTNIRKNLATANEKF